MLDSGTVVMSEPKCIDSSTEIGKTVLVKFKATIPMIPSAVAIIRS